MTIIFTLAGIAVFIFSLFSTKLDFKLSFTRLLMFSVTGLVLDLCIVTSAFMFASWLTL